MRRYIFLVPSILLCVGILFSLSGSLTNAQDPSPTPFSPIVPQANPNTGQVQPFVMSDIAVRTGITPWREAGLSGAGVRIGVLDRGFGGLLAFEEDFSLSVTTAPGGNSTDYDESPVIHGTQVLEVVHQVAPNADLHACAYETLDGFNLCIDYMIGAGVDIINHSAGVPALPLDGTNPWALQVARAGQADILWIQSAGNFAQGYYRDFLVYSDDLNPVHEFRGPTGIESALAVEAVSQATTGVVMLSWDDHNGQPANTYDLDLYIFDPETGEPIGGSSRTQSGMPGDEALEYDRIPMNRSFAIQIRDNNGDAFGIPFALYVEFATVPNGAADRSIIAPGDSASAITVGALQGFRIAPYSSRGPVGEGVVKPDIAAPGEIRLRDGTQFIGTSAAAPVVAGVAALLLEADPDMTTAQLRNQLLSNVQDDDQFPGIDTNYGRGRLYLLESPDGEAVPTPTSDAVESPPATNTPSPTEPSVAVSPTDTQTPTAMPEPANLPDLVVVPGSFQSEIGCASDWDPSCRITELIYDAQSQSWRNSFSLPGGSFEYKVALNGSWDVNYGQDGVADGANIPISLSGIVYFCYEETTNRIQHSLSPFSSAPGCNQQTSTSSVPEYPCDGSIPGVSGLLNQVHVQPSETSPSRPPVQRGSTVAILREASDFGETWYEIEYNNGDDSGWIPEDFVERGTNCPI